ncbi:hypothetical protein MHK_000809 [Candidatus Magnetomorum sp. HK-1]|nr:hypothetical protein MHK_000809 [Candidatus Magnetomorum sp. HK-1]
MLLANFIVVFTVSIMSPLIWFLRVHLYNYMSEQFSGIERKSIEPIALNIKNAKVRAMQRFISDIVMYYFFINRSDPNTNAKPH